MRKYLRSIARHNMEKAGMVHLNKRPWTVYSANVGTITYRRVKL